MPATAAEVIGEEIFLAARRKLYGLLDELKRGELKLGPADYARVDRVLLLLAARGIRPDDPKALYWLAPVLCGTGVEQAHFYSRFYQAVARTHPPGIPFTKTPIPTSQEEIEVDREPNQEKKLRRSIVIGIVGIVIFAVIVLGFAYLNAPARPSGQRQIDPVTNLVPPPDLSTSILNRPLAVLPIAGFFVFLLLRRSRRLMLLRAFAPSPDRSEKVAFAAAQPLFYGDPALRRAFSAFRRHWAQPSGSLHVRRSINATMRAGGRPELRYGTRPRTPEYVLLVDRETPRDHLPAAADLLVQQLIEERIIISRYDYYGDPRRLVEVRGSFDQIGQQLKLLDVVALHAQPTVLIFAEASTFFDTMRRPQRWVATLREWGRPILITPRPPQHWDSAEQEIEREGIPVIPALSVGLEMLAEKLKLGPLQPFTSWRPSDRTEGASSTFDLAMGLDRHRGFLLDEAPPPDLVVGELLINLRANIGAEAFLLLQGLAVFPRLEPALTVYLGTNLLVEGRPLLTEERLLALGRLPWLRVGSMPQWMRLELVRGLERERLEEVVDLLQSFLQPVEDPRTGAVALEIGRRRGAGFRRILLQWIKLHQDSDLDDRILVDALSGRDPSQLGVPIPSSLARKLKALFAGTEWVAATFAVCAAGLTALLHESILSGLQALQSRMVLPVEQTNQEGEVVAVFHSLSTLAWACFTVLPLIWIVQRRRGIFGIGPETFLVLTLAGVSLLAAWPYWTTLLGQPFSDEGEDNELFFMQLCVICCYLLVLILLRPLKRLKLAE